MDNHRFLSARPATYWGVNSLFPHTQRAYLPHVGQRGGLICDRPYHVFRLWDNWLLLCPVRPFRVLLFLHWDCEGQCR